MTTVFHRAPSWRTFTQTALAVATVSALAAGCSSAPPTPTEAADELAPAASPETPTNVHWRRSVPATRSAQAIHDAQLAVPAGAHLTYYGGPVISNIKVYTVAWGTSVTDQATMNTFFAAVTNSTYLDWLSEYNTPTQTIGRGTFGGAFVDKTPPTGTTVKDSQIQAELSKLIDAGTVPQPDSNSYYQFLFPPGITVVGADGTKFCVQTASGTPCAYHSTFVKNGVNVYYSPQPDYSGACGTLCGFVPGNDTASLTTASSHEMVEAITDSAVGLATTLGPPLGWYDNNNGEIGDICEGQAQGQQVAGQYVQTEWSNKQGKCVVSGPATCTPTCSGKACGSDGCGGSCGTCPSGDTCNASGQCVSTCTPSVQRQDMRLGRLRGFVRDVPERGHVQREWPEREHVHSDVQRQDMRLGRLRGFVRDVPERRHVQREWPVREHVHSDVQRQDVRLGRLRGFVRDVPERRHVQREWPVREHGRHVRAF